MAWTYADWATQTGDQAKLVRLNQHIAEVGQQIGVNVKADGLEANRMPVKAYYDSLLKERERLEDRLGRAGRSGRVPMRFNRP